MIKDIKDFEGLYQINEFGEIYSLTTKKVRIPYKTKTSNYLYVDLWKNGKRYKKSIHRLVAEHFVENENNFPVVDHIDNNIYNNHFSNLQWITQKQNVHKSYETMSQIRNYNNCELWFGDKKIKSFVSVFECCRFCEKELGLSCQTMKRYHKSKGYYIIKV